MRLDAIASKDEALRYSAAQMIATHRRVPYNMDERAHPTHRRAAGRDRGELA